MELPEIDVGRLIAGKYELIRLIGKGAMGEVWLATHNSLGGEFAIKLVKPSDDEEDETAAGRFQLEAQVSAKLSRKTRHIVSVSDHGEEDGLAYLVMEALEGESLEARIKRAGEIDLAETVAIVMQIARALGQAHAEQIFHRDLKPANVFLTRDEDGRLLVKLLDFGIARTAKPFRTRSPFMTGKDMVLGTPSYMSPEQARGLDSLDHRCDLWALGVVAYEALTQQIPWEGETVEDIFLSICTHRMVPILTRRGDLPPAIEDFFARAFAPKLDARFADAGDLSGAFEALVDPLAVEAALGPIIRAPGSSQRNLPTARAHDTPREMRPQSAPQLPPWQASGQPPAYQGGPPSERQPMSDPAGLTVGGATLFTKRKKSSGWLVGVIAAIATIAVVGLAVTTFSSANKATAKSLPTDPTTTPTAPDRTGVPPPDPTSPTSPTTPPTPPLTPTGTAPIVKATSRPGPGPAAPPRPTPPAAPSSVAVLAPPVVTAEAPPVVAPPAPPPTHAPTHAPPHPSATAQPTKDKGEVF